MKEQSLKCSVQNMAMYDASIGKATCKNEGHTPTDIADELRYTAFSFIWDVSN